MEKDKSELSPDSRGEDKLCMLLDQDDYLIRVLGCLAEDGLHECRLVCRKWYDACNKSPVQLSGIKPQHLKKAAKKFPAAFRLAITMSEDIDDAALWTIASFRNLKDLRLVIHPSHRIHRDQEFRFECFGCLTSLCLKSLHSRTWPSDLLGSVRCLTNLTSLELVANSRTPPNVDPFTELSKIQNLKLASDMIFNQRGKELFPALTSLTSLSCCGDIFRCGPRKIHALDAIVRYASSLRSLEYITVGDPEDIDWTTLSFFIELQCFAFQYIEDGGECLFPTLRDMDSLRSLLVNKANRRTDHRGRPCFLDTLFELTQLESMRVPLLRNERDSTEDPYPFSRMTQLTEFMSSHGPFGTSLSRLIRLVYLEIEDCLEGYTSELTDSLAYMPNLERVQISFGSATPIRGIAFRDLKRLASLRLDRVEVDDLFFQSLAALSRLTDLRLTTADLCTPRPLSLASQVTFCSNLRSLSIAWRRPSNPLEYLQEGTLPKLRYLRVGGSRVTEHERAALFGRFPCLRKMEWYL